jgi:hypothetical protein
MADVGAPEKKRAEWTQLERGGKPKNSSLTAQRESTGSRNGWLIIGDHLIL